MKLIVEKAGGIGFCYGVKRAIEILEKGARERGRVEALGAIVHNQQVLQRLAKVGVTVAKSVDDIKSETVAIGAHGVGPQLEEKLREKFKDNIINTTCPFVHRAQIAARRLARSDFFLVVYGDANHEEVMGILAWADGKGLATMDDSFLEKLDPLPRRIGVLSQTTQVPANFNEFVKKLIDSVLVKDSELRVIDTICHDIRDRQQAALELAEKVDLMLVIGSRTSANTNHLAELCATTAKTHLVETAADIKSSWLKNNMKIGVTGGASTADWTIDEVMAKLREVSS